MADDLGPGVVQLHSSEYRSAADLPAGAALVVGGGNTGFQIAAELTGTHEVHLAVGARQAPLPQRILGRDLFRYLEATRLMDKSVTSRLGQRMKSKETLIGSSPRSARRQGIHMRSRATGAHGATVTFADGSSVAPDAIVWATGFRLDHSFVELAVFDDRGQLEHMRGVTRAPGLYFLGLPWQHTRGSALLGWVKDDAEFVAEQISALARSQTTAGASPAPAPAGIAG
jgi:putative flavoprotein involved in K+ transport